MQLTGRRMRLAAPTGLYDVRFGEDMHVLIGCGLGAAR
jgi:cholesterol oxidase